MTKQEIATRPALNPKLAALVEKAKTQRAEEVFFGWNEPGATALVQITERKVINTSVGKSPLYRAVYLSGNLEGLPGGPNAAGEGFPFYTPTVLEGALERIGVVAMGDPAVSVDDKRGDTPRDGKHLAEPNVVLMISCLGKKAGKSYFDFVVSRLTDDDLALTASE